MDPRLWIKRSVIRIHPVRSGRQDGIYLGEFIGRKVNIEGADIIGGNCCVPPRDKKMTLAFAVAEITLQSLENG